MKKALNNIIKRKWFSLIILLCVFLLDALIFSIFKNLVKIEILNIFSVAIHSLALIYVFKSNTESKLILAFMIMSYILKLAYVVLDVYLDISFLIFNDYIDSYDFNSIAVQLAQGTFEGDILALGNYPLYLSVFYKIFGINRFMAQYMNIILASLTQVIFLALSRLLNIYWKKMIFPMLIICFFPLSVPFMSMLIRESLISFLIMLIIYFFIRWFLGGKAWNAIIVFPMFILVISLHEVVLVLFPVILFFISFYDRKSKKFRWSWGAATACLLAITIVIILFVFSQGVFFDKFAKLNTDTMDSIYWHLERSFGDSAYLNNLEYDSIWDIFIYTFPRVFYFLFSPVPWAWRGLKDMAAFIFDAVFYILFIIAMIPMYRKTVKEKRLLLAVFIIQFILFIAAFAEGTFTAGAAMRHRYKSMMIIMTIYLLAGDGDALSIRKRWNNLTAPLTRYIRYKIGRHISDRKFISLEYRFIFGKKPDLDNPVLFSEKLQWLKLNDRKPIYHIISDKYKVREYIEDKFGKEYLFPLYGVFRSYEEIDFEKLPDKFVLKPNHTSGDIFICTDKTAIDQSELKKKIDGWLKKDYYLEHREWQYKGLERNILCEKYMTDAKNGIPLNYKFFCFHGKAEVFIITSGFQESRTIDYFDMEFNPLNIITKKRYDGTFIKPDVFDELLVMVNKLAEPFLHVRIDTYIIDNKIYFGELTLHHDSGHTIWNPGEYDLLFGNKLKLPTTDITG